MTYNLFEDGAAKTWHADAERKFVTETSTKFHHLQLNGVTHSLQSHNQQSTDSCRKHMQKEHRLMPSCVTDLHRKYFCLAQFLPDCRSRSDSCSSLITSSSSPSEKMTSTWRMRLVTCQTGEHTTALHHPFTSLGS